MTPCCGVEGVWGEAGGSPWRRPGHNHPSTALLRAHGGSLKRLTQQPGGSWLHGCRCVRACRWELPRKLSKRLPGRDPAHWGDPHAPL